MMTKPTGGCVVSPIRDKGCPRVNRDAELTVYRLRYAFKITSKATSKNRIGRCGACEAVGSIPLAG